MPVTSELTFWSCDVLKHFMPQGVLQTISCCLRLVFVAISQSFQVFLPFRIAFIELQQWFCIISASLLLGWVPKSVKVSSPSCIMGKDFTAFQCYNFALFFFNLTQSTSFSLQCACCCTAFNSYAKGLG